MVRPTFLGFETARRAMNISQAGLDVVGNNIANVNTAGYTRQRALQHSLHNSFTQQFQIFGARGHFSGQGADLGGISQIRDPFLDTRFRREASTNGHQAVVMGGLMDIERILDEVATTGLHDAMLALIGEISKFAANADSPEIAVVVRNKAMTLTQMFNRSAQDLLGALEAQRFDLDVAVTQDVNTSLERIAYLNGRIREVHMFGGPANELQDERNLLLDKLAHFLPIQIVRTPEQVTNTRSIERVSVYLSAGPGSPAIQLIDNEHFNLLSAVSGDDGAAIYLVDGASQFPIRSAGANGNITDNITSGGLRGFLDVINGLGDFAGHHENSFRGIQYHQRALDVKAQTFARLMNQLNSISAEEAHPPYINEQSRPLFSPNMPASQLELLREIHGADFDPTNAVNALNITISGHWLAEANWFTTTKQPPSAPVAVLDEYGRPTFDDDGRQIFYTPSNSDNLLKFVNLLQHNTIHFQSRNGNGEVITLFRGTFLEGLISQQSILGLDLSTVEALLTASDLVINGFADSRDSISAVSMDEEAVNMMIFQNHYNAAARFMTVLDEAVVTIIERMGLAGR